MVIITVVIFLSALILVHELGHFLAAKLFSVKVEEFGFGFPPKIIGKKIGETVYSLNLLPFGGFVKITGENGEETNSQNKHNFSNQLAWKKSVIILSGIIMNIALAWFMIFTTLSIGIQKHLVITDISANSPAATSELKPGDIILEVKGSSAQLTDPINSKNFINFTKKSSGEKINLIVKRGNNISPKTLLVRENPPSGEGPIGVAIFDAGKDSVPFPQSVSETTKIVGENLFMVGKSLLNLIINIFINPSITKNVTGPIGIFNMATETGKMGVIYLAELMSLISLNLAVLNLMPFPALDGGRLLFIIIEKIKGKKISFKTQAITNTIGFIILLALMALVTFRDIQTII